MKIIDISMAIEPTMTVYKNKEAKKPTFHQSAFFDANGVYETDITLNLHSGTHMDFPLHTIPGGKNSNHEVLDTFIGDAKVFDLTHLADAISLSDIKDFSIEPGDFVLFKTRNSQIEEFDFNFVYLALDAATYLSDIGIRGVGIDTLGIERNQPNHPTHDVLLLGDVIILEGLRLGHVEEGTYELICLPLKISNVEASLTRAVLVQRT
jgi:arylformamidase